MTTIGIDPGHHNGAAVVLRRSGEFAALVGWKSHNKGAYWTVTRLDGLDSRELRLTTYGALAEQVRLMAAKHVVRVAAVEGFRWGVRGNEKRSPRSIEVLAQSAGALSSAVEQVTGVRVLRPDFVRWRKAVLKLTPSTSGEAAKRAAMIAVGGPGRRRLMVRIPCQLPEEWGEVDHAAEAACIAEWARREGDE